MSADLRTMSEDAFWNYELREKGRISDAHITGELTGPEAAARWEFLGEAISLYVKARMRLHMDGYIPKPHF